MSLVLPTIFNLRKFLIRLISPPSFGSSNSSESPHMSYRETLNIEQIRKSFGKSGLFLPEIQLDIDPPLTFNSLAKSEFDIPDESKSFLMFSSIFLLISTLFKLRSIITSSFSANGMFKCYSTISEILKPFSTIL